MPLPFLVIIAAAACRSAVPMEYQVEPPSPVPECGGSPCPSADEVAVTYLGVSGFVIRYRGNTLLTGPSFSNPGLDSVTPSFLHFFRGGAPDIVADSALIERLLPHDADDASMILVGHGHYDHLLDVPYIATHRARQATIYGSRTVRHILMGNPKLASTPLRVLAIDTSQAGTKDRVGRWFYNRDSTFRVMALNADHAPTLRLFRWTVFASGTIDHDLDHLPRKAEDWKLGEPFSFIIDVLARGDSTPKFRIYFQDAPNTAPLGFPPARLGGRGFDLAILCVATARNVSPQSPDDLVKALRPKYVIAAHWESFFRPQTLPLVLNPASDVDAFFNSLTRNLPIASRWTMPMPRTTIRFAAER
jgi:L-ascorbate metabolism protein UlaG (beta-lactamase superfamily)